MSISKNPKYDLKMKYTRIFEIGIICSLLIIITLFKYFPRLETEEVVLKPAQELIDIQDIEITKHEAAPPPPPKPLIPVETPAEEILEDIELQQTELDINEAVTAPPPPQRLEEENEEDAEPVFFVVVEQMPQPVGGIEGIQKMIKYPDIAKRAGIQGRVFVKAYVDERGIVTQAEVIKGIGGGCDEVARDAVMQTQFIPGKQRGKPVKVQVMIPVRFRLVSGSPAV